MDGFLILENSVTAVPKIIKDTQDITVIQTILQEAEAENRNKRSYSLESLKNAIYSPMVQEKFQRKTFYGEAGHPLGKDIERQTNIDQSRISHIVTEAHFDGNILRGTVESANTATGRDFQGLIRQGSEVSFSMRGMGGVSRKIGNINRIEGPLYIICYDWVVFPSHSNAYMEKIIKEDANMNIDQQMLMEGASFTFNMQELSNYIIDSSKNVRELCESQNFTATGVNSTLDLKNKMLNVNENGDILKIFLEDYIVREIDDVFKNIQFKK